MKLVWDESAWEDYVWWQQQDRKVLKRINTLITDIQRNGNEGIGRPAPLKHGSEGLFYLDPGSLGTTTSPSWTYQDFPVPNGAKSAVIFLNAPDRQGRGEVTATLRADGTASLLTLERGRLGPTPAPSRLRSA